MENSTPNGKERNVQARTVDVIPFSFEKKQVRTLVINDQPWFVASDVAAALCYRDAFNMNRNLDDDEKGTQIVSTPGGDQEMLAINESGLYSAILRSRKAEAKRFKKWVTAEVLPAIRRHGQYVDDKGRLETLVGQTIGTDGFHCLAAVVDGKAKRLPAALRRGAKNHLWSQVHKAFSVVTAEDIPASQLDAARNFVAAYALEGEWLGREAIEGFAGLIGKRLKRSERWLVSLDPAGKEQYTPVPENASVLSYEELIAGMVSTRGDIPVSIDEMFEFVMAAILNIKSRSDHMRHMLRSQRAAA
ncbi:BRO-N domain-containing protein [Pseudomonas tohonis]|uniref:BRO-N domain-containing protein n=1 Tax=Pseudomonas tohonis TaxID=2725477 RepID=UPI001F20E320|nr:Bro-N domain-containing protein [Pseudomonas tohonis]